MYKLVKRLNMMQIDGATGLLHAAKYCSSENCDQRDPACDIDLLVIHGISLPPGEFGNDHVQNFFTNQLEISKHKYFEEIANMRVSSHLFIRRNGEIVQFVPFFKRAWHAGESSFRNRKNCNDYSIGIELEGTDTTLYTNEQYDKLSKVTHAIMQQYPKITLDRIVGHFEIAPIRKTDPGPAFDWGLYLNLLSQLLAVKQNALL